MTVSPDTQRARAWTWAITAAGLVVWAALPWFLSRGTIDILVFAGLYTIAGLGVSFLLGQCGIVSLAQSGFYGIGAYAAAYGTTALGLPIPVGIIAGMVVSGAIAAAVGIPVLRLSGHFLALATLALAIIAHVLFLELEWLTGGTLGIGGIPRIALFGFTFSTPFRFYYLVWPCAFALILFYTLLLNSRTGIALRAMRDAPAAAAVAGIPITSLKVRIFVLSAAVGSLAGSLFAHYVSFISVDSFAIDRAISFLLIAVLGGVRSIPGTIAGALFVTAAPNYLSRLGDIHPILFAVALIVAVIFLPGGFGGFVSSTWRRLTAGPRPSATGGP
ncbi:branched-chain amino acid ABC transporter permease [Enterovirga rhinocerotis]|uniref:Amino acid/amide ABC transporter membrane protein 2 (HAAT family) n=1 Tax=Enterovirga rhinocerotis TaxID=1339210 RepID=A0A4R7BR78_9HYPH|nr:branched-chain amino acid ABC transporter permease [Enterovirga rhinocerotis]TDR88180.1 amino acid/amide ABC transporter membrane protein 2 (HAAT family) [Enterovirga rhinocerotis]